MLRRIVISHCSTVYFQPAGLRRHRILGGQECCHEQVRSRGKEARWKEVLEVGPIAHKNKKEAMAAMKSAAECK